MGLKYSLHPAFYHISHFGTCFLKWNDETFYLRSSCNVNLLYVTAACAQEKSPCDPKKLDMCFTRAFPTCQCDGNEPTTKSWHWHIAAWSEAYGIDYLKIMGAALNLEYCAGAQPGFNPCLSALFVVPGISLMDKYNITHSIGHGQMELHKGLIRKENKM